MTRVALAQLASDDAEQPEQRTARVQAMLSDYAGAGIDLFVLPELWRTGYLAFDRYRQHAEPLDGATVRACRHIAVRTGAWVHTGSFIERDPSGRLYNTAALIDPAGVIVQRYRKIHLFGHRSREAQLLTPGDTLPVTPTPLGLLASTTCYDLRFPGLWLELSARGVQAAIVPAAWPAARREHFRLFTAARAAEHQLWLIAVNACGVQGGTELAGASRVVDPWGRVVFECGESAEQCAVVDIDPRLVQQARTEFAVLADRLPVQAYAALKRE